jgi:hypothetical protein
MRGLIPVCTAALLAGLVPGAAGAQSLCASISIPDELELACTVPPTPPGSVTIQPTAGEFAALSSMRLRELDQAEDPRAWSDPPGWLREQLSIDTSGISGSLRGLTQSPDSPFAGEGSASAIDTLTGFLGRLGRLPLSGCEDPVQRSPERWEMRCDYETAGTGLHVVERLEIAGDRRFAIMYRTMNEQRLRHFEAIANSFNPG